MTHLEIKGKTYGLVVNLGTLTFAEMINEGVPENRKTRLTLGFALACLYGADRNCGLTLDDLIAEFDTSDKYRALMEAVNKESSLFEHTNASDETVEHKEADTEQKKS